LLNRYRDGNDTVARHNDREAARMMRPTIASLVLGATRGDTQTNYDHRVPKDPRVTSERINLTFRRQMV
jgi:alkylated DNA repair dioxygenase AlkB